MPERSLAERVESLEQNVGDLQSLPERVAGVGSQILQLRGEMHGEFSAIREELLTKLEHAVAALRQDNEGTRNQARVLHEECYRESRCFRKGGAGSADPCAARADSSVSSLGFRDWHVQCTPVPAWAGQSSSVSPSCSHAD